MPMKTSEILDTWTFDARIPHLVFAQRRAQQESRRFVTDATTGRHYTYAEVGNLADAVTAALGASGCGVGDVVAWFGPPSVRAIATWFGIARSGALEVSLGDSMKGPLLTRLLVDSRPSAIVLPADSLEQISYLDPADLQAVHNIICIGASSTTVPQSVHGIDVVPVIESGGSASNEEPSSPVAATDVTTLMYTSGTTGPAKAVMMSHHQLFFIGASFVEQFDIDEDSVLFHYSPFNHLTGRQLVLAALLANCRVVIRGGFSPSSFWTDISTSGCTHAVTVGSAVPILLNNARTIEVPSLTHVWAVPAMPAAHREIEKRYGVTVYVPYGSTEIGIVTMPRPGAAAPEDNCGQVSEFFEMAVLDPHDQVLPSGSVGEIAVRPRVGHSIFSGYWQLPEVTNETCRSLWYHTRDYGSLTEDGFLTFADRKEGFLRSRGENVSSAEVERVVGTLPFVSECAVISRDSDLGDSDLVAVLVPALGASLDPQTVFRELAALLPHYMVPTVVWTADSLPRTPSGKIEKYRLSEQLESAPVWDARREGLRVSRRGVVDASGSVV